VLLNFTFGFSVVGALVGVLVGLLWAPWSSVLVDRPPLRDAVELPSLPFRCPVCRHGLVGRSIVPLLSFLVQRGRCLACGVSIPRFEVANDVLCVVAGGLTGGFIGLRAWLPAMLVIALVMVPVTMVDLRTKKIATKLVYPAAGLTALLLTLATTRNGDWKRLGIALAAGVATSLLVWLLWFVYPAGMGPGDARLCLMLGFGSGWFGIQGALLGIMFGFVLGSAAGVPYSLLKFGNLKAQLPFGPFLGLGALLLMWFAP
jgi:leader peptidase (prepilin peptidase) / N-methyltransferase